MWSFKTKIANLLVATLILTPAFAFAGYKDGESGCRLVLCLANPQGPMSESECRQDIKEMFIQRAKKHPFIPGCPKAKESGTFYTLRNDHYDLCPAGLVDSRKTYRISPGYVLEKNVKLTGPSVIAGYNNPAVAGRSVVGNATSLACVSSSAPRVTEFCLNKRTGKGSEAKFCGEDSVKLNVYRYDKVVRMPFKSSPVVADVYIDNKMYQRTRIYENDAEIEWSASPQ